MGENRNREERPGNDLSHTLNPKHNLFWTNFAEEYQEQGARRISVHTWLCPSECHYASVLIEWQNQCICVTLLPARPCTGEWLEVIIDAMLGLGSVLSAPVTVIGKTTPFLAKRVICGVFPLLSP